MLNYSNYGLKENGSAKLFIQAGPGTTPDQGIPAPGQGFYGAPQIGIITAIMAVVTLSIFAFAW